MSIDFAYAQARAQAHVGERPGEGDWRVLESSLGLSQYLASVRNTVLAPHVRHFSATASPHTIERTLRDDWRDAVAAVGRWVPDAWQPAVAWTAWLPYLDAVAWLLREEPVLDWMRDDTVLAPLAVADPAARRLAIDASPCASLLDGDAAAELWVRWFERWQELTPATVADDAAGLRELVAAVRTWHTATMSRDAGRTARRDARSRLVARALRLVHRCAEQPVVVFCHLVLVALDLQRLRDGLLRRALFHDPAGEQAA